MTREKQQLRREYLGHKQGEDSIRSFISTDDVKMTWYLTRMRQQEGR